METKPQNSNSGKLMGIFGLILGILAALLSFIPCLGMYAFFPGIIGLALSVVSFIQANKAGAAKGLAIAGIVCSVIGTAIAAWQYSKISAAADEIKQSLENFDTAKFNQEMNNAIESVADSLEAH
jgi:hypothetical protein